MKILHLSTFDTVGGAARAGYRVHQGLSSIGVRSQMLVQKKVSSDANVVAPKSLFWQLSGRMREELDGLPFKILGIPKPRSFSTQWVPDNVVAQVKKLDPDVINLHWTQAGYMQIESLARLNRPIVWTLMDMWPFTGGCHYTEGCEHYTKTCGTCPQLGSQKERDISRHIWQRKAKAWKNLNLTVVAPSQWMADCAQNSSLFADRRVEVIPFCLDTQVYKLIDQATARASLNLPQDKKLILFGAISATQDPRKGFHLLQPAIKQLAELESMENTEVVVFGSNAPEKPADLGFPVHYMGHMSDDVALALVYSAADVMVAPSTQEAFGQTASEAMACGIPVVAFADTGLADIVAHHKNGYLARPADIEDLADGIRWILEDSERYQQLRIVARQKAEKTFPLKSQAESYISLYREILNKD